MGEFLKGGNFAGGNTYLYSNYQIYGASFRANR